MFNEIRAAGVIGPQSRSSCREAHLRIGRSLGPAKLMLRSLTDNHAVHLSVRGPAGTVTIITAVISAIAPFSLVSPVSAVIVAIISVSIIGTIRDARRVIPARPVSTVVNASAQDAN